MRIQMRVTFVCIRLGQTRRRGRERRRSGAGSRWRRASGVSLWLRGSRRVAQGIRRRRHSGWLPASHVRQGVPGGGSGRAGYSLSLPLWTFEGYGDPMAVAESEVRPGSCKTSRSTFRPCRRLPRLCGGNSALSRIQQVFSSL